MGGSEWLGKGNLEMPSLLEFPIFRESEVLARSPLRNFDLPQIFVMMAENIHAGKLYLSPFSCSSLMYHSKNLTTVG